MAAAHPHIFVDAGLRLVTDAQGRIVSVDVTWRYDELYSLILLQDYGLDPDFDLVLDDAEVAAVLGFDLNWGGGFDGGLRVLQGGAELDLGAPEAVSFTLLESGQIETVHRRAVTGAAIADADDPVTATVYDPEFYVAFEMILDTRVAARPECRTELVRADLDQAYDRLAEALVDIGGAVAAEDNFPQIGAAFADRVVITCDV